MHGFLLQKSSGGSAKSIWKTLIEMLKEDSRLQKQIIKWIDPENLLELEEELKEILQAERALIKLANRFNITPNRLQQVIDDLIDIINLLQI